MNYLFVSVGSQCKISISQCPKNWTRFEKTDEPNTRFCKHCEKNVYLCTTEEEAVAHAHEMHCIAMSLQEKRDPGRMQRLRKHLLVLGRPTLSWDSINNNDDEKYYL
jgi:hypothetical protein